MITNLFSLLSNTNVFLAFKYLRLLKIPVSFFQIKDSIVSNPTYPSLLAFVDGFKSVGAKAGAFEIEAKNLSLITFPVMCQTNDGEFYLVTGQDGEYINYINANGSSAKTLLSYFLSKWNNRVIYVESSFQKKQSPARNKLFSLLFITAALFCLCCAAFNILSEFTIYYVSYVILKLFGVIFCTLILFYEEMSFITKRFCNGFKNGNCDAVLNSNGSKLFGIIPLSHVGFFYFSFTTSLLLFDKSPQLLHIVSLFSLVSILFIPYSIYYQKKIVKQWCALCLCVLIVLLLEFCFVFLFLKETNWFTLDNRIFNLEILKILQFFIFNAFALWLITKALNEYKKIKQRKQKYSALKYNDKVFYSLLKSNDQIDMKDISKLGIFLGNNNSENLLLMICSPFCNPCAVAHGKVAALLNQNLDIKVQIIFYVSDDIAISSTKAAAILFNMCEGAEESSIKNILAKWYHGNAESKENILKQNFCEEDLLKTMNTLSSMRNWCKKASVQYTPTFFFNGHEYPKEYEIDELKHFIEDLDI